MREFDQPPKASSSSDHTDLGHDPFAEYLSTAPDSNLPPKILITTSMKAGKATYDFCEELVGVFPGAEFVPRTKGKGFEMGRIAGWAADRGFRHMCVVNEDMRKPSLSAFSRSQVVLDLSRWIVRCFDVDTPPKRSYRLLQIILRGTHKANLRESTSERSSCILIFSTLKGHARATVHFPELVLNNFVTGLGHTVGRMLQTLFPPIPEFQGRQVVTFHNQRDFLFFRRHRCVI
jgi:ribosome production factor 1